MNKLRPLFRYIMPKLKNLLYYFSYKMRNNNISFFSVISKGTILNHCKIQGYSYVGHYSHLNSVHIGRYTSIAPYVIIGGAEHSYWWYSTSHFISKFNKGGNITSIGHDVWIGAHAIIKQGITIGNGAVIGAGSVVLSDVEPYSIVVGVPAKKIRMRFDEDTIKLIDNIRYWDYSPKIAGSKLNKLQF